jgi:hypothetical protein
MDVKNVKGILSLLALVLLLGIAVFFLVRGTSAAGGGGDGGSSSPNPMPTNLPTVVDPRVQELRNELDNKALDKAARESIEEKLKMAERIAAERFAGAAQPRDEKTAPALPPGPLLSAEEALNVPEGIFEGSQGLIRPSMAQINNGWQGVRSGEVWQVFAGALADDAAQGLVIIFRENPEKMNRTLLEIQAPGKTGSLSILSVKDHLMVLQTGSGSQLTLNLDTLSFEN